MTPINRDRSVIAWRHREIILRFDGFDLACIAMIVGLHEIGFGYRKISFAITEIGFRQP